MQEMRAFEIALDGIWTGSKHLANTCQIFFSRLSQCVESVWPKFFQLRIFLFSCHIVC